MKKKVLFIQLKGNSFGGIWQVINTVSQKLVDINYEVNIVSLRENKGDFNLEHNPKIKMYTINKQDIWEDTYSGNEIITDIKSLNILKSFKKITVRIKHEISILKDKKKIKNYIFDYNPDYIVAAHYQILDMIPKQYLHKTINHHHTSFEIIRNHKATINAFKKYNGKIKFLWLSKSTMEQANKYGIKNNRYIYNPNRIKSNTVADVINNKKLITIARLSKEKNIDKMINIVSEIFKNPKYQDWCLEIYGKGSEEEKLKKIIENNKQIKLMGLTNNPKKELLTASINLNTSSYEGFALSILEANECGVPTITFNFGESAEEEILNEKTGIIAKDAEEYKEKLKELMDNHDKLKELSTNAKKFSNNFQIETIIQEWIELFKEIDK